MTVQDECVSYKIGNNLKTNKFEDRVKLQRFLKGRLEKIWSENPRFSNGGLFKNDMTGLAMGFAYYDCRPSPFCKVNCYGLPIAGIFDCRMFRLAVITSESLKTGDPRYLTPLLKKLEGLRYLKIGHWGDAVLEQIPVIAKIIEKNPNITFWWYTRKLEIAKAANELTLPNLRAYLSLDPTTNYPTNDEYPYGITYFIGDSLRHDNHKDILNDQRLVAIFPRKKGCRVEDPRPYGIEIDNPKLCKEHNFLAKGLNKDGICFSCHGRCNYRPQ